MSLPATRLPLLRTSATGVSWSCDGKLIATAQADQLTVWDSATSAIRQTFTLPGRAISRPSFGPTPDKVACTVADGSVCLWSVESGGRLTLNSKPEFQIRSIEWAPDGTLLAGIMSDGQIGIWDSYSGGPRRRLKPLHHAADVLAWSSDSRFLASAGEGHSVCIWEAATGALKKTVEAATPVVFALAWSRNVALLAIAGTDDCRIQITKVESRRPLVVLEHHQTDVRAVSFSPSGEWLASKSMDGALIIWECDKWQPHSNSQEGAISDDRHHPLEFSPRGNWLASCDSTAGHLALYEIQPKSTSEQPIGSLTPPDKHESGVGGAPMAPATSLAPPLSEPPSEGPIRLFLSYAHEDSQYKNTLLTFLKPLERTGMIAVWDDRQLLAGSEWDASIQQQMSSTDIFLVLVTAASVASDYIVSKELTAAINAHRIGRARIIPVVMEACAWQDTRLRDFQALPPDAKPVTSSDRRAEAYQEVVEGIKAVVADIQAKKARST